MILKLIHIIQQCLFGAFFPERCCGCGKTGTVFCHTCLQKYSEPERIRTPYTTFVASVLSYRHVPVRKAIRAMKYRSARVFAETFGQYMASHAYELRTLLGTGVVVSPIPLSSSKMRKRGYNQAESLARAVCQTHGWTFARALEKTRDTKSQTECKNVRERRNNVKNSFAITPGFSPERKTILLVDDVLTSGATIDECACVLKEAGAEKIYGIVLAKG